MSDQSNGTVDAIAARFLGVIHAMPLGRLAEHRCPSLVEARLKKQPITGEIIVDFLETFSTLMQESEYVTPDAELMMEYQAAIPLLRRLADSMKGED